MYGMYSNPTKVDPNKIDCFTRYIEDEDRWTCNIEGHVHPMGYDHPMGNEHIATMICKVTHPTDFTIYKHNPSIYNRLKTWMLVCNRMNILPQHIRLMILTYIAPTEFTYKTLLIRIDY